MSRKGKFPRNSLFIALMQTTQSPLRTSPRLANRKSTNSSPKEPPNHLLASPNAFDWEKRLMMSGSSPAAFNFTLSPNALSGGNDATTTQLYDYPKTEAVKPATDMDSFMLLNQMNTNDPLLGYTAQASPASVFSSSSNVTGGSAASSFFNPLGARRSPKDRQDAHRESERRRRENMKASLALLEGLVMLAVDRCSAGGVLGKGPNRRLSHAEIYSTAREMIVALKKEITVLEADNNRLRSLQ